MAASPPTTRTTREDLTPQVERLFSLLRRTAAADPGERPGPEEARELAFWRQRVSAEEWAELQASALVSHSSPVGQSPCAASGSAREERGCSIDQTGLLSYSGGLSSASLTPKGFACCACANGDAHLSHDPADGTPWGLAAKSVRSPLCGQQPGYHPSASPAPATSSPLRSLGAPGGAASIPADELSTALAHVHGEYARLQHELEREHQRSILALESTHARVLAQAQRDEDELREQLERTRRDARDELNALRGRIAHSELVMSQRDRDLHEARAQAEGYRVRAEQLGSPRAPEAEQPTRGPARCAPAGSSASGADAGDGAASGGGPAERLLALRGEISSLLGMQGGRVQDAEQQVGSLLLAQARLSCAHSGAHSPGDASARPLPSLSRLAANLTDAARARTLARGLLSVGREVRAARSQLSRLAASVFAELRETEAEWNGFVHRFSRLWEATVVGTAELAGEFGAARERVRSLDTHAQRLARALRTRAAVPTRVLCAATLPAPGVAVRCALDVRAQSVEVAQGPERRVFRFDRVATLEAGAGALPALAQELGELLDAVSAGGCATVLLDGPRGAGKSRLLDGRAAADGSDGLLGAAVQGLLLAAAELEQGPSQQLCALWLSVVDVGVEASVDLLGAQPGPRGSAGGPGEWAQPQPQPLVPQPQLAAVPSFESFVQLASHLRSRSYLGVGGADADASVQAAHATGQWLGPFSLRPRRAHRIVTLHLERSTPAGRLGTSSLTFVELAASGGAPPPQHAQHAACASASANATAVLGKSVAAVHGVLLALAARQQHVPYRHSRLTQQLQQALGSSGIVLLVLPVQCALLTPTDDACRTLAIGDRMTALELGGARGGTAVLPVSAETRAPPLARSSPSMHSVHSVSLGGAHSPRSHAPSSPAASRGVRQVGAGVLGQLGSRLTRSHVW